LGFINWARLQNKLQYDLLHNILRSEQQDEKNANTKYVTQSGMIV